MRKGERHAFNEIYYRYWEKLYRTAVRRTKSSDDARDMVQDLFVSLWMKRETLVVATSLAAYLFTAIKYKIISYIEANITKADYLNSLDKAQLEYDNSTADQIVYDDTALTLQEGINSLSPKVRQVFVMSREQHLSVHEIAEKLQLSHQTVKNQISTALKALRIRLYSDHDNVKN